MSSRMIYKWRIIKMIKKIIILILSLVSFPIYSNDRLPKKILPNVLGSISIEENEIIFTLEGALFSHPYYIVDYELSFEVCDECIKVYISLLYTTRKPKKTIGTKNEESGKFEIRIPRERKLKSSNLLFFYKDYNKRITELPIKQNIN